MNYIETLRYLYESAPLFQNIGAGAYKEGLENTHALDAHFDHPHRSYRTLHIAGTNGKGSTSHTLAAILQAAGYKVGLYTSPHLVDFRERIRVNGVPISEQRVIDFVERERAFFEPLHPSFFELTTALAFKYFAEQSVDFSVIEVGLGGRLDCTNVIRPVMSVITNISLDHTQFLGDTLPKIAEEKAGIIKQGIPAVVGETTAETRPVFEKRAAELHAPIFFAEDEALISEIHAKSGHFHYFTSEWGEVEGELMGECQKKNTRTLLSALRHLPDDVRKRLTPSVVKKGFASVTEMTGLTGRWQVLSEHPRIIADTGHNLDAWRYLSAQLKSFPATLHIVFGACEDKDIEGILGQLPQKATYYFTQAGVKRALPAPILAERAKLHGLLGRDFPDVPSAVQAARQAASPDDTIFIGGSSFVVADWLSHLQRVD